MLQWLAKLFRPREPYGIPARFVGDYRVFVTEFDRVVRSDQINGAIELDPRLLAPPDFDAVDEEAAEHYEASAAALVGALVAGSRDLAVSILLDHSGSTRGRKSCITASAAGVLSECLSRLAIPHEVLGFTTRSWRGGKSARSWRRDGSPPQPGRLCDLLHVVHKDFATGGAVSREALEAMTNPHLLKENVDGEAVLWAVERLRSRQEHRKLLFVISDGVPVDDATLMANGPNILDDHLRAVTTTLIREGEIEIYGMGIEYAMFRYYPQYCILAGPADIGKVAVPVLQAALASHEHAPRSAQTPLPGWDT